MGSMSSSMGTPLTNRENQLSTQMSTMNTVCSPLTVDEGGTMLVLFETSEAQPETLRDSDKLAQRIRNFFRLIVQSLSMVGYSWRLTLSRLSVSSAGFASSVLLLSA